MSTNISAYTGNYGATPDPDNGCNEPGPANGNAYTDCTFNTDSQDIGGPDPEQYGSGLSGSQNKWQEDREIKSLIHQLENELGSDQGYPENNDYASRNGQENSGNDDYGSGNNWGTSGNNGNGNYGSGNSLGSNDYGNGNNWNNSQYSQGNNGGSPNETNDQALNTLMTSSDCWNSKGLIDSAQLSKISNNTNGVYTQQQVAAANYLINNPTQFNADESASNGQYDGQLGKSDCQKVLGQDMRNATQDLINGTGPNGQSLFSDKNPLTLGKLRAIAENKGGQYSESAVAGAQFYLQNPNLFMQAGNTANNDNDGCMGMTDAKDIVNNTSYEPPVTS